jgi:hypothetical protein
MENPQLAEPGWYPRLVDYCRSLARAKLLMLSESALSAITVLLVAARAVDIFR